MAKVLIELDYPGAFLELYGADDVASTLSARLEEFYPGDGDVATPAGPIVVHVTVPGSPEPVKFERGR